MVGYIEDLYSSSTTRIIAGSEVSSPVSVARGVKQGDPMSPFLFNLVLDTCLRKLEGSVRLIDALRLNHIAFADDVVLIASKMDELQCIFDSYTGALEQIGLEIHPGKCQSFEVLVRSSLRLSGGGGHRTVHTNAKSGLKHKDAEIPVLSAKKLYKYLGVKVGVDRNRERSQLYEDCTSELSTMLRNLSSAPLRPPQRMQILKVHRLPKLDHRLALSAVNKGLLRRLDRLVRREVIRWLHLQRRGVPLEFFHSPVMYGGLGIRSYAGTMVDINDRRLNLLIRNNDPYAKWLVSDSHSSQWCCGRTDDQMVVESNDQNVPVAADNENVRKTRRKGDDSTRYKPHQEDPNLIDLYDKCGYEGLKWQPRVPQSSLWIDCWKRRLHITGWDYTKGILVRGGLMATPVRKARIGLTGNPHCPTCPDWIGTAAHCLQSCPRTHGARIARHDYVLDHLVRSLRHRDSEVKVLLAP